MAKPSVAKSLSYACVSSFLFKLYSVTVALMNSDADSKNRFPRVTEKWTYPKIVLKSSEYPRTFTSPLAKEHTDAFAELLKLGSRVV